MRDDGGLVGAPADADAARAAADADAVAADDDATAAAAADDAAAAADAAAEAEAVAERSPDYWRTGTHVFVLSNAGKPIFSTSGSEADLASLTAVMQALVSYVRGPAGGDELRSVEAGGRRFVFVVREPLYLVAVTSTDEPAACTARMLHYVHLQVLFILTSSIDKVFSRNAGYDLRALLGGTDKALQSLILGARTQPDVLLEAVPCVPLPPATRAELGRILQLVDAGLLFAILTVRAALVTVVSPRRKPLGASDLILVHNLLSSSQSLRATEESWVPLCLPGFEPRALLHAHVSFLDFDPARARGGGDGGGDDDRGDDDGAAAQARGVPQPSSPTSEICLMLITHSAADFHRVAAAREQVVQRLHSPALAALRQAAAGGARHVSVAALGIEHLEHFVYSDRTAAAYVAAEWPPPLAGEAGADDARASVLLGAYRRLHAQLHATTPPLSVLFIADGRRAVLGHAGSEYELYTAHSPLCTKAEATAAAHALLRWVRKERGTLLLEKQLHWPS